MSDGTTLAKAYVQIMPSATGISGKLSQMLGGEVGAAGDSAGRGLGSSLVGALKGVLVAAGIGSMIKEAITAGGQLEQAVGGVKKIFGTGAAESVEEYAQQVGKSVGEVKGEFDTLSSSQSRMLENAQNAYKTAGMSANDYMEAATSFGASLLEGLGGDTQAAVDKTDMAIQDMSDNVNTFGTNQEDVLNAYKGFAKQNYTMLDNLKLGYGGTKTEMQRLLVDAQKLTGVKYDINNLGDVYDAIHAIQGKLNITGTTAREASTTFEGSASAMKAAWQNLLADIALGNDLKGDLEGLTQTVGSFLGNLIRMIGNAAMGIPTALSGALSGLVQGLNVVSAHAPEIVAQGIQFVSELVSGITNALPYLAEAAINLVVAFGKAVISTDWSAVATNMLSGISSGLKLAAGEILGANGPDVITALGNGIVQACSNLLTTGTSIIQSLVTGITNALPGILTAAQSVVMQFITTVLAQGPQIIAQGVNAVVSLTTGILQALPQVAASALQVAASLLKELVGQLPQMMKAGNDILKSVLDGITELIPVLITTALDLGKTLVKTILSINWLDLGVQIVKGIIKGLLSMAATLVKSLLNMMKSAVKAIKEYFGIHSPSRLMANEVGQFLPSGIALGAENNTESLTNEMKKLSEEAAQSVDTSIFGELSGTAEMKVSSDSDNTADEKLDELIDLLTSYMPMLAQRQLVLDTGAMVGELAPPLDRALGEIQRLKARL